MFILIWNTFCYWLSISRYIYDISYKDSPRKYVLDEYEVMLPNYFEIRTLLTTNG